MPSYSKVKAYQQGQGSPTGGYQQIPQPGSPAYSEGWALIEAARRMAVAIQSGPPEAAETRRAMREALKLNWRLWTVFQANLTVDEKSFPEDIRINMLTLCKFVDKHTVGALPEPTPRKLATLIDINRNIASGLLQVDSEESRDGEEEGGDSGNAPPPGPPTGVREDV